MLCVPHTCCHTVLTGVDGSTPCKYVQINESNFLQVSLPVFCESVTLYLSCTVHNFNAGVKINDMFGHIPIFYVTKK